jgi:putative NADPH-quinone reductase/putative sterol carrier protein
MKILVVNGSPRGAKGNTEVLVEAFLEGAREAGAEAETVYLNEKKINHCIGCFACWVKTPGVCVHKDDMPELLDKIVDADVLVAATPLYVYTVSGLMKDFMDRVIPLVQPFIDITNGVSSHPARHPKSALRKWMLISNCGFPEPAHFSGLKETFRSLTNRRPGALAGMICCAGGAMLRTPGFEDGLAWYLDAVRRAGREVVAQGVVSDETQSITDRPLVEDQELYAQMANDNWRSLGLKRLGEEEKPAEPILIPDAEQLPPPIAMDTVRDVVSGMAYTFHPEAAGDLRAVVQFIVPDEAPGKYFLAIADGKCTACFGEHPAPSATLTTPADVWLSICRGEMSGATAFMTGKYRASGDLPLLMRFDALFSPAK